MDDAHEPQSEHSSPYLHLPWPAVAAILVAVLGLLLAAGIYANRNLRPQVGIVPTPPPLAIASTSVAAATATTLPVSTSTPAPSPLVVPTRAGITPTPQGPTAGPTSTTSAAGELTPSPSPTLDPLLVAEVSRAYDQYWQVRSQALLELDKTHLSDVMGGEHLNSFAQRI